MSQALAQLPAVDFTLTVLTGPDKGTAYRLLSASVTLGRGSDNDVVVNGDPKVSRKHARIIFTAQGVTISDLTNHNKLLVNGEQCQTKMLTNNSEFTLGDTRFRFNIKSSLQVAAAPELANLSAAKPKNKSKKQRRPKKSPLFRIVLMATILLLGWLFISDTNGNKDKLINLRTEQQMQADVMAQQELLKAIKTERQQTGKNSPQFKKAQTQYIKGFRDYQKGQFERALESFQACLSLFPSHSLCKRYLSLAQKRHNELIQYHMILGRRYEEQNQFKACQSSFRNVMVMVRDTNSKVFREAKINYDLCRSRLEGRY